MLQKITLHDIALRYHRFIPERIHLYLKGRGLPDEIIHRYLIGWNGRRITIPIRNRDGEIAFFKLARDPNDSGESPKMLTTPESSVDLYGWARVLAPVPRIVICEGEFDRLVLEAQGFPAVTSTGGARSFSASWASYFTKIPEVFICFGRDESGEAGAKRVASLIPHAKLVRLPDEVGPAGDVADFFVTLGHTGADFEALLNGAAIPAGTTPEVGPETHRRPGMSLQLQARIRKIKQTWPIVRVVAGRIILRPSGETFLGKCPFHTDRTPSFTVFPETESFHCFGCGAHGDVIDFIQHIANLSFGEALDRLEEQPPPPDAS